jgi:hypothetical protein
MSASFSQVQAPVFLTGPMAVLLTNSHDFSAHVTLDVGIASRSSGTVSGDLLVMGNRLFFAQAANPTLPKRLRAGAISFIWDVPDNHGHMLSEALQGYAPISFSVHDTNLVVSATSAAPQKVDSHPCSQETATVSSSDGTTALFHVWRALDLSGLPVRISGVNNTIPMVLNLSRFRLAEPPVDLFKPPDGFTKYDTAEAMMGELSMRQQNLKRRVTDVWGQSEPSNGQDARHSR